MDTLTRPFTDALAATPFVLAQGRNIEAKVYAKRYPASDYASHLPIVTEGPPWATGTTFFTVETTGEAKFISGAGTDMPFNSALLDNGSSDFALIGAGWQWTLEEVNQAAALGIDLYDTDAIAAGDKVERLLHSIAMRGSAEKGWTGFVNSPVVPRFDVAATGFGASRLWSTKTVDLMLGDIYALMAGIRDRSNEIEWADTLRLPPAAFRMLSVIKVGTGEDLIPALEYLRNANVYTSETGKPLDIAPARELSNAGAGGTGRMVAYRKDPEVLRFHLPMPRTTLQPRQKALMGFETGIIARTGGVEVRLPGAVAYADGMVPGAPVL